MQDRSSFRLFEASKAVDLETCFRVRTPLCFIAIFHGLRHVASTNYCNYFGGSFYFTRSVAITLYRVSLVASSASSDLYICCCSILVKLFCHSKIATVGTNDYFNKMLCRREEGFKMQDLYLQENQKSFCFYFHNRKLKSERA